MEIFKKINDRLHKFFINLLGVDDETSNSLYKLFRFAIYSIIIIFIINIIFNQESFGAWGDFFGGVLNPILTFLTFMGLLITIILQQTELREAREEFKGQKEALENQQIEMKIQSFDNKFFQMMNFFTEMRKEIKISTLRKDFESDIYNDYNSYNKQKKKSSRTLLSFFNNQFHSKNSQFKYYFLNLYQILKYIDEDIPNQKLSKKYINFLRAQLSTDELILLAYNAIGVQSFTTNNYQLLVEKYEFFEHLELNDFSSNNYNISKIINCILQKYNPSVFGNNKSFEQFA